MSDKPTSCIKAEKLFVFIAVCLAVVLISSFGAVSAEGAGTITKKEFNNTVAYAATTFVSFAFLLCYCAVIKKKETMFILLFAAVFIINLGYLFGAASITLGEAMMANRISYVGAVFLPLLMLIIIIDECGIRRSKLLLSVLVCISGAVFLLTMTPGYTDWYYKSVDLVFVSGGAKLVKEYGPLHKLYYVYLAVYFLLMVVVIATALTKKLRTSHNVSVSLLILVFANIMVWLLGQKIDLNFEFLSVSYLITEIFLLVLYQIPAANYQPVIAETVAVPEPAEAEQIEDNFIPDIQDIINVWPEVGTLTTRETEVFCMLVADKKRKDIAEELCVSENTIKKHTANIFAKLGVSSRTEIIKMLYKTKPAG